MNRHYLLDTNICIYLIKGNPIGVTSKFENIEIGRVAMSIVTYGELLYGAAKSNYTAKSLEVLQEFVNIVPVLPMPIGAAKYYGDVRSKLEKQGKIIGGNDLWIASHALALKSILITNNEKEFSRVADLEVENWI